MRLVLIIILVFLPSISLAEEYVCGLKEVTKFEVDKPNDITIKTPDDLRNYDEFTVLAFPRYFVFDPINLKNPAARLTESNVPNNLDINENNARLSFSWVKRLDDIESVSTDVNLYFGFGYEEIKTLLITEFENHYIRNVVRNTLYSTKFECSKKVSVFSP